jgi:Leucine-rich repeat (LRR) protein
VKHVNSFQGVLPCRTPVDDTVNLSARSLTVFPTDLAATVRSLDLSRNRLDSIPTEIGMLTTLTSLNLASNDIEFLPTEVTTAWSSTVAAAMRDPTGGSSAS